MSTILHVRIPASVENPAAWLLEEPKLYTVQYCRYKLMNADTLAGIVPKAHEGFLEAFGAASRTVVINIIEQTSQALRDEHVHNEIYYIIY